MVKLPEEYPQMYKHSQEGKALVKTKAGYLKSIASTTKLQESEEYLIF